MIGAQRLFVGIALSAELRTALAARVEEVRGAELVPQGLRWLAPETWHVTLQFLGSVPDARIPDVRAACRAVANATPQFELEFGPFGAFGNARSARLIWLGVARGGERLVQLAEATCEQTQRLGFVREERAFHPHVTLARLKQPRNVAAWLTTLPPLALTQQVAELTLFRSQLAATGARYEAIECCAFGPR